MMKRIAALLLTGALFVTGCGGASKTGNQAGGENKSGTINLTLASMSPLSGSNADLGNSIRYGAELALKDRAEDLKKVGLNVSFLAMDDQAKPEQGTQLAEQLLTKKEVIGVVGTLNSGVAIPVSQKLSSDNLVMVSPANTALEVTDRRLPNMNRICARDDMQGPAAAKFIKENLKVNNLFIIHDKTPYGQGLAEQVKKTAESLGMKVDGFEGINVGEKDFSAVLTKVKGANSPAIFFGGLYAEAAQILKQMKEKGISAKFVGADGLDSGDLVKLAGDAATGVFYTSVASDPNKTPEGQAWAKRYTEFAKKPADGFSIYAYDAAQVIIEALIKYAKENPGKTPTRKDIQDLVRKTSGFKGVASTVTFDEKGDNKEAKVFIYEIQNGKYPGVQVQ
jgi:branched-chain amino acid transport system substrate-binding protein